MILSDVKINYDDKIYIDGKLYYNFESDIHVKIRRTLPDQKEIIDSTVETQISGDDNNLKSEYIKEEEQEPRGFNSGIKSKFSSLNESSRSCLWNLLFGIIGFIILSWLFSSTGLFIPLLGLFILSLVLSYFKSTSSGGGYDVQYYLINIIGWILMLYGLYALYNFGFSWSHLILAILGLGLILGARSIPIYSSLGRLMSAVCLAFLIYLNADFDFNLFDYDSRKTTYDDDQEFVEDGFRLEEETVTNDDGEEEVFKYYSHNLSWRDNKSKPYQGTFRVRKDLYHLAKLNRNKINPGISYWHDIYQSLVHQNSGYLNEVLRQYSEIGKKYKLNRKQFADMVVTSVQSIPYYLVHDLSHEEADKLYGGFIKDWHSKGGLCVEKMKFGILSPSEFMATFKGDCDTRSVLLFHILSRFGYDVVILASDQYSHAIIGLSGNYRGLHKTYRGIKYFAWETTVTGWVPGTLDRSNNNMNYWDIVLTN